MVRIVPDDGLQKLYDGSSYVGYVESDTLYLFNRDGYAVEVCKVGDVNEASNVYYQRKRGKK